MSGLIERMMSWVSQQCQDAGPAAPPACVVVGNPEEARVAGRRVDEYLTGEAVLHSYGMSEGPRLVSMVNIYMDTRIYQEFAPSVSVGRFLSDPFYRSLILSGFTPVASMESGATMSCEPDPECGRTMSCP